MSRRPADAAGARSPVYDLVGVGFGPSNLALAIAITEHNARSGTDDVTTARFLERQPRFGWHRGMLLDDATMQVSFLKDLATLRNPTSEFSFLSYLHSVDRLVDFINHKSLFPLRVEFHDYLEWAASKVDDLVSYDEEVVAVEPVVVEGQVAYFDVVSRAGGSDANELTVVRTRNLVVGVGLRPDLPDGVRLGERIWHSGDLLDGVRRLEASGSAAERAPSRFVVVGAGQSAAEAAGFLHSRFPEAEVCAVFSRYGYSVADDSSFANRIFDPSAVDEFFHAPPEVKRMLLDYHANTNYSVVDGDLIEELYRRVYQEKVLGTQRLRLLHTSRVTEAVETPDGVRTTVESLATNEIRALDADVVVYATGYRPADPTALLGDLARHCRRDEVGRLCVERDYRLATSRELSCGIYLQGGTEHTHGITSSLLSNTALRAGEILQSVLARSVPAARAHPDSHTGSHTGSRTDRYAERGAAV